MKTLNNFILEHLECPKLSIVERLKINNDSKISKNIPRKFVYKTIYTETEVDIIEKYAQQLEIKPVLITNEEYLSKYRSSRSRSSSSSSLFLYFDDDLENTYRIWFIKDELSNDWSCRLLFRYDEYCYYIQDKKGDYILYSKNVEDICKELLIQIKDTRFYEEAKEFYNEVKKSK